jgi:hypothetical protein
MKVPALDSDARIELSYLQFVGEIEQTILDDVEGTGGLQRYVLQALASDKHTIARLPLRYTATRTEEELDSLDSEPATAQGLLGQAYRHNEARERIDKAGWGTLINVQARTIETLAEQNNRLMGQAMDFLETLEEVASAKHVREMEVTRENNKAEIKQGMARQFGALMPAIAKKFGVDIGDSQHPDVIQLRSLMAGMTEDQVNAMMSILKPEQVIELLTIIKRQGDNESEPDDKALVKQAREG